MYTPSFQRKSGSEPIPNSFKLGREIGGMTFLGLGEIGEITFFPSLTVTVAVAVIMVIVIAITHKNYVVPSSRSALNDNFLSLYLSVDSFTSVTFCVNYAFFLSITLTLLLSIV
jgi:hypothetical protein